MGYYINQDSNGKPLPNTGKADALLNDGAVIMDQPEYVPGVTVCVVNNGPFEAAAYAYSEDEFQAFNTPDGRRKTWLMYDKAKELAK